MLPCYKKEYKEYIGSDNKKYYLDSDNKRVGDSLGNWVSFQEPLEGVLEENISFYIEKTFKAFYEMQKDLNDDFKIDKMYKIKWR